MVQKKGRIKDVCLPDRGVTPFGYDKVRRAASAGGVSGSSFPNGDTRGRATNDVNATPGAKLRAGHQKHHSVVGHLDSRPAPHYRQVFSRSIAHSSPVPSRCLAAPPHAGLRRRLAVWA